MFRSTPTAVSNSCQTVSNSAPNTDDPKCSWVSGVQLVLPTAAVMLVLQSAAAVTSASSSAAAAASIGFDYFSDSDPVSSSVSDHPPSLLHSVDRVLEELARQHLDDLGLRVNMINDNAMQLKPFSFSAHSAQMPSPRRVADPTGVYGQQDAAEGNVADPTGVYGQQDVTEGDVAVGDRKHSFSNVSNWNDPRDFRSSPSKRSASNSPPAAAAALPLLFRRRGHPSSPCASSSSSSPSGVISGGKAVDYASFAAAVVTLILNINNNVNNRNNNNNNFNLNAVSSSNVASNSNTNIANQVNIQPPGGRKRRSALAGRRGRRGIVEYAALVAWKGIQVVSLSLKHVKPFWKKCRAPWKIDSIEEYNSSSTTVPRTNTQPVGCH